MLSFGRTGILIRTGPAIPTTCRALNFVDPLLDLLVIRIQCPSSHHHQRPSYHLPSCLPSLVRNHRTESILILFKWKASLMCPLWLDLTKSNSNLGHRDSRLFLNIIAGHPYQAEVLLQHTHHVLPEGMKILSGYKLTKRFHLNESITWKTSGRPREGCGPNDPGVQPQLRRLQARTLRQIYSMYTSNHILITWRKPNGPHKQQGVKLSSLGRLLF